MRVAVTGTPGTGKTTATELLESGLSVIHLTDVVEREGFVAGYDDERESTIVDTDAVAAWLEGRDDVLFESHLAHHFDADRVVVCRCHPDELERRLASRGARPASIAENVESEALDVILVEAVERHGSDRVYELETTELAPEAVADEIAAVVNGEREPSAGTVSYIEWL